MSGASNISERTSKRLNTYVCWLFWTIVADERTPLRRELGTATPFSRFCGVERWNRVNDDDMLKRVRVRTCRNVHLLLAIGEEGKGVPGVGGWR